MILGNFRQKNYTRQQYITKLHKATIQNEITQNDYIEERWLLKSNYWTFLKLKSSKDYYRLVTDDEREKTKIVKQEQFGHRSCAQLPHRSQHQHSSQSWLSSLNSWCRIPLSSSRLGRILLLSRNLDKRCATDIKCNNNVNALCK